MAGSFGECSLDGEEEAWRPPTEAEMKVIEAKRERSDRIAKLMGSYLLKGYKMLATQCTRCQTIELQDKQGNLYCIACEEVDPEIQKDNPVFSEEAASSQRAESQYATERDADYESTRALFTSRFSSLLDANQPAPSFTRLNAITVEPVEKPSHSREAVLSPGRKHPPLGTQTVQQETRPACVQGTNLTEDCTAALNTVHQKLNWATSCLEHTTDTNIALNYIKLLTHCAECITALKKALN